MACKFHEEYWFQAFKVTIGHRMPYVALEGDVAQVGLGFATRATSQHMQEARPANSSSRGPDGW